MLIITHYYRINSNITRTAYFSDVMYANNVPYKEGTILPREESTAYSLALLHQRYSQMTISSVYSVSNATLFNISPDKSIRIGRFKIPLATTKHILSVLDPISIEDMRQYSVSNALVKLLQKSLFQNKRKRQTTFTATDVDYLDKVIYFLEYSRYHTPKGQTAFDTIVPINPLPDGVKFSISRDKLTAKISDVNRQYFVDNFIQSVIDYAGPAYNGMVISCDGSVLHSAFSSIALRIASGNRYKHCYITMTLNDDNSDRMNNIMTTDAEMTGKPYINIILRSEDESDFDGNVAIKIQRSKYDNNGVYEFDDLDYENIVTIMKCKSTVRLNPSPLDTAAYENDKNKRLFGDTVTRHIMYE